MAAEYNHHHRHLFLLIAVVLLLLVVSSNYTNPPVLGHRVLRYIHVSSMEENSTTTTTQKEKQDHLIDREEKHDRKVRRSIALTALDRDDPTEFLDAVRNYYENTYFIHPETKVLVRVYVNPRGMGFLRRCRRCRPPPPPITEADWKRYEAAVKRTPTRSWITSLDVARCRLWLEANPSPL